MDDFADTYLAGRSPIPCVRCNQTVKFRDLAEIAGDLGADAMATGHYVRWHQGAFGPELHRAVDGARDQSYFLFATTRAQLAFLRFPLGGLEKAETRKLAARFALPVAAKPDSQDICFVPDGNYAKVVEKLRPQAFMPGDIVDGGGNVLGRHEGIAHFTVGQRRGLGLSAAAPLHVLAIEPETNRVVVGPKEALLRGRLTVREVNWLGEGDVPDGGGIAVSVKLRSMQPPAKATIKGLGGHRAEVVLDDPQAAVAPGQACVFYDGDRVLGGGWIERPS